MIAEQILPQKRIRIMDKPDDARKNGNEVAIFEEQQGGKLTFLVGGPTLELAINFLIANLELEQKAPKKEG